MEESDTRDCGGVTMAVSLFAFEDDLLFLPGDVCGVVLAEGMIFRIHICHTS